MQRHRVPSEWETMKSSSSRVRLAARASDQRWRAAMADTLEAPISRLPSPRADSDLNDDDAEFYRFQKKNIRGQITSLQ